MIREGKKGVSMAHMQQFYTHTHCVRLERLRLESEGGRLGAVYDSVLRPPRWVAVDVWKEGRRMILVGRLSSILSVWLPPFQNISSA